MADNIPAFVPTAAFLAGILTVFCLVHFIGTARCTSPVQLPPGPRGLPIIGNALQLPFDYQERTYFSWAKEFGEITYARLFRSPIVVVNSVKVARDLMEKKSANFSDRPRFTLLGEVLGLGDTLPLIPYGDRFRKYRRWFHDAFMVQDALVGYRSVILRERNIMLKSLLANPNAWTTHLFRYTAATVVDIAYGHRVTSDNDAYVEVSEKAMHAAAVTGSAGSMLIDIIPFLKDYPTWLPGAGFKIKLIKSRALLQDMLSIQYNNVRKILENGGAQRSSFAANLLEEHVRNGCLSAEDDKDIKGASGTLYAASTESMVSVMRTFVLAMTLHPEVLEKAQDEMDQVVGTERLPYWDDRGSLPYLECILKEVLRWNVPVPLAVPHVSTHDDTYGKFKIPARSMVIGNIWGMSQDKEHYHDPERFIPERFAGPSSDDSSDPRNFVFGFGRRICPGKDFADKSLFMFMACMIATMKIGKNVDVHGNEITPTVEYTSGFARRPKEFQCRIAPRSQKAAALILTTEAD